MTPQMQPGQASPLWEQQPLRRVQLLLPHHQLQPLPLPPVSLPLSFWVKPAPVVSSSAILVVS
jgi:hypothetical protein